MVNFKQVAIANGLYLVSFLACAISAYIVPTFISETVSAFTGIGFTNDTLEAIAWVGLIIIWVLSLIVMPVAIQIIGLMETDNKPDNSKLGNIKLMIIGVLWFLFSALTIYLARNWPATLISIIPSDYTILKILFWMELATAIIMNTLVIPAYTIMQGKGEETTT